MAKDLVLRREDLITNPTPRVPICLVLDRSPSMSGEISMGAEIQQTNPSPIEELNDGIEVFFDTIKEDEVAKYSAEIAIVAFSYNAIEILDFDSITRVQSPIIDLETEYGGTSIGQGVDLALTLLDRRKKEYQDAGVDYFQPWLVLMTDGQPTDKTHIEVSNKVVKLVNKKKLTIFPIGIGEGADIDVLAMFSPKRPPLRLKGLRFKEFFEWLSASVSVTSQSTPGEVIPLDTEGIKGWGEL